MIKRPIPSHAQFPNAWQVDNLLFLSGQVSISADGTIIGKGDIQQQTFTTFQNLQNVLEDAGSCLGNLIKLNTYLVYRGDDGDFPAYWSAMNEARLPFLQDNLPAATAIVVERLAHPDFLIEVDGVATLD